MARCCCSHMNYSLLHIDIFLQQQQWGWMMYVIGCILDMECYQVMLICDSYLLHTEHAACCFCVFHQEAVAASLCRCLAAYQIFVLPTRLAYCCFVGIATHIRQAKNVQNANILNNATWKSIESTDSSIKKREKQIKDVEC